MGDKYTVSGESVSMLYTFYGVSNPSEDVSFPDHVVRQTTAGAATTNVLYWGSDVLLWGAGNELEWGT
jgi:hypothetical protein